MGKNQGWWLLVEIVANFISALHLAISPSQVPIGETQLPGLNVNRSRDLQIIV